VARGIGRRSRPGRRLADVLEALAVRLWPAPLQRFTGWLLLLPDQASSARAWCSRSRSPTTPCRTSWAAAPTTSSPTRSTTPSSSDAGFQISDAGLGSALAVILVLVGSTVVAALFALLGAGTMGFLRERSG
jgi:hypothetical protein